MTLTWIDGPGEVTPLPSLGKLIRRARFEADEMHQEQLAQAVGVSRPLVSKWERDLASPDAHQFRAIIAATGARWLVEFFTDEAA